MKFLGAMAMLIGFVVGMALIVEGIKSLYVDDPESAEVHAEASMPAVDVSHLYTEVTAVHGYLVAAEKLCEAFSPFSTCSSDYRLRIAVMLQREALADFMRTGL